MYACLTLWAVYKCSHTLSISHNGHAEGGLIKKPITLTQPEQAVGGRPPRYAPPLSSPWTPKRLAPPSRRQHSRSFPRPKRSHANRCSRLTRQHGREQSGLVTLTFDLFTLKVVSESRVTCAILVFLGLSVRHRI